MSETLLKESRTWCFVMEFPYSVKESDVDDILRDAKARFEALDGEWEIRLFEITSKDDEDWRRHLTPEELKD